MEACDGTPREGEEEVAGVVNLAGFAVCDEQRQDIFGENCTKTEEKTLHHPSHKIESPVLVLMNTGFSTAFHGN